MVKRTSLEGDECPIARALDVIGDWWSLLIIRDAFFGVRRFSEFQKELGLAKNILTVRLRTWSIKASWTTAPASDGSAYQEYVLTPKGRGSSRSWWRCGNGARNFTATARRRLPLFWWIARKAGRCESSSSFQDGRLLTAADTALKPRRAKQSKRVPA